MFVRLHNLKTNCLDMSVTICTLYLVLGLGGTRSALCSPLPVSSGPEVEYPSPEEGPFFEGDIVQGSEIIPVVEFKPSHRNLATNHRHLWPQKTLYYEFSPGQFQAELRALVEEALQDIMEHSCVRFLPKRQQTTYLRLKGTGKGCNSKVGYPEDEGPTTLQVAGRKCHTLGTVQHEFLHALGLWHEHTRADRDDYVTVVWDNVRSDRKGNFAKRTDEEYVDLLKLPYDYGSVMHYTATSFTKHRGFSTLVPRHKGAVRVMGQRAGITRGDIAKLNRLYNCTGDYYMGKDLEGKKFLLGQFHKTKYRLSAEESYEGLVFAADIGNNQQNKSVTSESAKEQVIQSVADVTIVESGNTNKSQKNEITDTHNENLHSNEVRRRKNHFPKESWTDDNGSVPNKDEYASKNTTGITILQNKIQCKPEVKAKNVEVSSEDKSLELTMMNKTIPAIKKHVFNYNKRRKRETASTKSQWDGKTETANEHTNEHHDSFAPQKILPDLLKGVLNSDNDRPIVIQFAIYQPIVYKSSNQSEPSSKEEKRVSSTSEKDRRKEHSSGVDKRTGNESSIGEDNGNHNDEIKETQQVKSTQKTQDFDQEHEDRSRYSSPTTFSEKIVRKQHEDDDRIDVRSFNDRESKPREEKVEHNRNIDYEDESSRQPTKFREDHLPEIQTEYTPVSDNHDVTVSKKEYIVSPHDSHVNGQELRVSQTDYKFERKASRNSNTEISQQAGYLPKSEEIVITSKDDEFKSSDVDSSELSYSREYTLHSPSEKDYFQSIKDSHRDSSRYESSSLIHFSEGKGTKSTNERENNNNFQHPLEDKGLYHSLREEERLPQPPPLLLKQDHQPHDEHSPNSQDRTYKNLSYTTEEYDIAPDFHETSVDEQVVQSTKPQIPTYFDSELKKGSTHDILDYPTSQNEGTFDKSKSHKQFDDEDTVVYVPKSSDIDSDTESSIIKNFKEDVVDRTLVRDRQGNTAPNENKPYNRSRGNSDRVKEPYTVQDTPRARTEEQFSRNSRNKEIPSVRVGNAPVGVQKRPRPDIVIDEDFSIELDIDGRGKKLEKIAQHADGKPDGDHVRGQETDFPTWQIEVKSKNRAQSIARSTVFRKKIPNSRTAPEEQEEFFDEADLISKPQTSKLNLNPRQALPLRTSVVMGKKTCSDNVTLM